MIGADVITAISLTGLRYRAEFCGGNQAARSEGSGLPATPAGTAIDADTRFRERLAKSLARASG
jgi:hypothetical protein